VLNACNGKLPIRSKESVIEISPEARKDAITSIKRYFEENMPEPIGDLPAGLLLTFFVEEVGPIIYNRAVADVQARLVQRVEDLESELFVPEFQYWPEVDRKRKRQR
jgi:uncharacterized protein (DUF2164 family)